MTEELRYVLSADPGGMLRGFAAAEKSAGSLDKSIAALVSTTAQWRQTTSGLVVPAQAAAGGIEHVGKRSADAGFALMSLSRIVQDAPYGFTAVANNVTMSAEALAMLTAQAGGGRAALSAMAATLMGPGGLILLLSAGVAGLTLWSQRAQQAKKDTGGLKDELSGVADQLFRVKENETVFQAESLAGAKALQKEYEGMIAALERFTNDPLVKGEELEKAKQDLVDYRALYNDVSLKVKEIEARERLTNKLRADGKGIVTETNEAERRRLELLDRQIEKERERRRELLETLRLGIDRTRGGFTPPTRMSGLQRQGVAVPVSGGDPAYLPDTSEGMPELDAIISQLEPLRTVKDELYSIAQVSQSAFGAMASAAAAAFNATGEKSMALFAVMKAASIAEALANTYVAATAALKLGPVVGPILAGTQIAAGMLYVSQIAALQPGSSAGGGGRPGIASAFRSSPGGLGRGEALAAVYSPGAPPLQIEVVGVTRGEDIYWSQRRVAQRHRLAGRSRA